MLSSYIDFEVTFQARNGGVLFYQVESPGGESRPIALPDLSADAGFQALLARLRDDDTDEDMLIELGKRLYDALFQPEVQRFFAFSQGAQSEGNGIRVKLRTAAGDTEVASIPWEFLYDPNRDNPFVLLDISVVRYPQAPVRVPNLEAKLPLRVLITGAQPSDMSATYADREIDAVVAALKDRGLDSNGQIEIVEERHLTRMKFQRFIRQGFHVWHFAGHGGFKPDGRSGVLFFEDLKGGKDAVSARELSVTLSSSGVRLILLDACESGGLALEPFRSIAPALIGSGTPAVIAMQFTVPEETTTAFASEFYAALAEALPVDACVTEGRKSVMAVAGLRRPDWGIPVVYTRAPDGVLFRLPEKSSVVVQPTATGGVSVHAPNSRIEGGINITTGDTNISGNTFNSGGKAAENNQYDPTPELQEQLNTLKRRYYALAQKAAYQGIDVPVSLTMEIEDIVKDVRRLEKALNLPEDEHIRKIR